MNIFVLDKNPIHAATVLCDKHIVKMIVESAQMLCNVFPQELVPYKRTHYNHPCSKWVRKSRENFFWLFVYSLTLCNEYSIRYNKTHKSREIIYLCYDLFSKNKQEIPFIHDKQTPFVQAMPEEYKTEDAVQAYRTYYIKDKSRFAKWKLNNVPEWYIGGSNE